MISEATTIHDIATAFPEAARVFDRAGIDYGCGVVQTLREACQAANLEVEAVIQQIKHLTDKAHETGTQPDWGSQSLHRIVTHVLDVHHKYLDEELPRLEKLMNKVYETHGKTYGELLRVHEVFFGLKDELESHLRKEEAMLFPYILRLEYAQHQGLPRPSCPFGTVANPIRVMLREHESAEDAMQAIRNETSDYTPPPDTCLGFKLLLHGLEALEHDLTRHLQLENQVLFPKAIELETHSE
ncbi:MAG TPA: iron-sulfur cluster repair di-iron protein [Acidobacteriota bacterium]|jgi:regulator of cell morphogenesis and NO signaling|nr:iron-sulfur cluster repair di-iron protein [Acidobacteriota bacterium]